MVADKDLSPLSGLVLCNVLSGGLRPRLLSFHPSGAKPANAATEFRDSNPARASPLIPRKQQRDIEARSQETEGIGAVLALGGCFELDTEILASCFRLLASNENKILAVLRITV
jgi:hypothetical protein